MADVNLPSAGPLAQMVSAPTQLPAVPPIAAALQRPKLNIFGVLADALAGAAGRPGPYSQMLMMQRELGLQQQIAQMNSDRELGRQIQLYDYQRTHPNDELTQYMSAAHIDPDSPQGQAILSQAVNNRVNPFVAIDTQDSTGAVTRNYVRPPMAPTAPVGALSDTPPGAPSPAAPTAPQGGPTPPASGSFPKPSHRK